MKKPNSQKGQPYSKSFKASVVQTYLSGEYSAREVKEIYNLPYTRYVYRWVALYRTQQDMDKSEEKLPLDNSTKDSTASTELPASVEELQAALFEAKMKIAGLEKMIVLAEERFHIPIRKKSGSKQ